MLTWSFFYQNFTRTSLQASSCFSITDTMVSCEREINPFPHNKFWTLPNSKCLQTTNLNMVKMAESSPKGQKTLWDKEKLLVTSNFSFSHSVFKRLVLQTRKNQGLFGKGLSVFAMTIIIPPTPRTEISRASDQTSNSSSQVLHCTDLNGLGKRNRFRLIVLIVW